jgi:hypothetical protein
MGVLFMETEEIRKINKNLFYWNGHNFGDELNTILFEKIFGIQFNLCTNIYCADYIAIGSILGWGHIPQNVRQLIKMVMLFLLGYNRKKIVIGSGLLAEPPQNKMFIGKIDCKVVRGKLTQEFLKKKGLLKGEVVLGDPGLLASFLYDGNSNKKYKLGIIPHYSDINSPVIYDIYKKYAPDCILINVQDNPKKIIKEIAESETIISSSLHGLIVSDSLNIPNLWIENQWKYGHLDHFKYLDYYSIFDINNMVPIQAIDFLNYDLCFVKKSYKIDHKQVKAKQEELYTFIRSIITLTTTTPPPPPPKKPM